VIYSVQRLIRIEVPATSYYEFVLEQQVSVPHVIDAQLLFCNTTTDDAELRIKTTISVSGTFSDTFTLVDDVAVPKNSTYAHVFGVPLVRDGIRLHTVRYINNDSANRYLYAILSGWADIKTTLSGNVVTS
jgi:hypothetical protein